MNHYRNLILCSALISCTSTSTAETLQQTLQYTIDESPLVQSASSQRLAIEQEIMQAKAGFFPTVDINIAAGAERSLNSTTQAAGEGSKSLGRDEASLNIRQMIYDGFATSSEVKRQTARTNAQAYTVFGQAEITSLNAVEAYINVLRRQELWALANENLAIHSRTNEQIQSRSSRGVGRQSDTDQSTGRYALAQKNVLSELGNLKDAQTTYLRVVGKLPFSLSPIEAASASVLPQTFDAAIDSAIANHPILKSANSDIEQAFAQHATAKSAFMPKLDFELGATHNKDIDGIEGVNEDITAMLRLRFNLYNGGRDTARRKETAQLVSQAKSIRDNTYRQTVESMRLSWTAYETVKQQLEFFEVHKQSIINTHLAYQKQFNIGRRSLLDLLDSANELYSAKSSYTNAKFDELYSQYRILASAGSLNKALNIKLPNEVNTIQKTKSWIGDEQGLKVEPTYIP